MGIEDNALIKFARAVYNVLDGPVTFFREKIVEPNQKDYPWYHEKFRRVPTIDECYTDDPVCYTEADLQFKRDKQVDSQVLVILRSRMEQCSLYHGWDDAPKYCSDIAKVYEDNATNWFIKYGDLGVTENARKAYMKQKHRMVWERRHGPVGSGMKTDQYNID